MTTTATESKSTYHHCDACDDAITTADAPVECAACRPPDLVADVLEFHQKFGLAYDGPPRALPDDVREFRVRFLNEERQEYAGAVKDLRNLQTLVEMAASEAGQRLTVELLAQQLDALVDLVYVALGNAVMQGFITGRGAAEIFNVAWRRVHAANMAKERARPDGSDSKRGNASDVVKPPGWRAPDHSDLVADHAHRGVP